MQESDKRLLSDIEQIKQKYSGYKGLAYPDMVLRIAGELEKRILADDKRKAT